MGDVFHKKDGILLFNQPASRICETAPDRDEASHQTRLRGKKLEKCGQHRRWRSRVQCHEGVLLPHILIWGDREEVGVTAGKVFVNRNPTMLLASWFWESQHFGGNLSI